MYNKSAFTNFNNHNYDFEEKKIVTMPMNVKIKND